MNHSDKVDVIVVGAGHSGLTMAYILGLYGLSVAVIDQGTLAMKKQQDQDRRTTALSYSTMQLYEAIGLADSLKKQSCPILDIRVSDKNSFFYVHFDHEQRGKGPMGWITENVVLSRELIDRLALVKNIRVIENASIERIDTDAAGAAVQLKSGARVKGSLLIGADGKNSYCRKAAKIGVQDYKYDQKALICTIKHTKPHHNYAVEYFFPNGPFALLPMCDNRMSVVWAEPSVLADDYVKRSPEQILGLLSQKITMDLGEISIEGKVATYPLSLSFAETYVAPSLALIGDAAHGVHPLAGQGFNLGVRDVAVLAEEIVKAKRLGLHIGSLNVLEKFEQARRFDNGVMIFATDFLNRLFSNQNSFLRRLRNIGFWTVERTQVAHQFFMAEAMGDFGSLPLLLQGKSL